MSCGQVSQLLGWEGDLREKAFWGSKAFFVVFVDVCFQTGAGYVWSKTEDCYPVLCE